MDDSEAFIPYYFKISFTLVCGLTGLFYLISKIQNDAVKGFLAFLLVSAAYTVGKVDEYLGQEYELPPDEDVHLG